MADIRHRVGIAAPPERVFEVLTTLEGLASWWTRDVDGDPTEGGLVQFYFGSPEPSAVMEVVGLAPSHRVEWDCVKGPDDWVGTTMTFELEPGEDETVLLFTHAGWREPGAFLHHCSTKWGYFLVGLKVWLEGGASIAYPADMSISGWG
jgi:uncharacterized protein YndB with AHSA1/START domain